MTATTADSNFTTAAPTRFEVEANKVVNRALVTISATLSVLGTTLIIGTFVAWKDYRSISRRILVYISIADFFVATSNLFGVWRHSAQSDIVCETQSFVSTCASLWSFFWTTFLAVFLYTIVAKKKRHKAEIMLKVFHVFGWGIPLIIVGTALGLDKLGNDKDYFTSGWCWIKWNLTTEDKHLWMLLTGKAWEIAAYILCSAFYLMLKIYIRREVCYQHNQVSSQQSRENALLKLERRLTLVPVIFVLVRIWGTIRFILYLSDRDNPNTWWEKVLLYFQGIGDSSQGFFNFLLFCLFTEKFQTRLRLAAHNLLLYCNKEKSVTDKYEDMCNTQEILVD